MRCRSMLSSECSILSGSRPSGNRWAKLLVSPIQRSTCRRSTNPPSLLTFPPAKLPSIFLPLSGGHFRERLLALSDRDHICTYTILESPLPITDYVATIQL